MSQGTLEEDQFRRDFTINAIAISLNKENFGTLLDPFTGLDDLEKRLLRTPRNPNTTYTDDPLRMLRAVRFATQLDFSIVPESLDAIRKNAERIKIISKERIVVELNQILETKIPEKEIKINHIKIEYSLYLFNFNNFMFLSQKPLFYWHFLLFFLI